MSRPPVGWEGSEPLSPNTDKSLKFAVAIIIDLLWGYRLKITQAEELSLMRRIRNTILRLVKD